MRHILLFMPPTLSLQSEGVATTMPASKKISAADSRQKGQKACRMNACRYSSHKVAPSSRTIPLSVVSLNFRVFASGTNGFKRAVLRRLVSNKGGEVHFARYRALGFKLSFAHQCSRVASDVAD